MVLAFWALVCVFASAIVYTGIKIYLEQEIGEPAPAPTPAEVAEELDGVSDEPEEEPASGEPEQQPAA